MADFLTVSKLSLDFVKLLLVLKKVSNHCDLVFGKTLKLVQFYTLMTLGLNWTKSLKTESMNQTACDLCYYKRQNAMVLFIACNNCYTRQTWTELF